MSYASERKILTPVLRKLANRDRKALNNRDFSAAEQILARWGRQPKKLDPKLHKKLIEQKREKQSSRASHNQETDAIYMSVAARAAGMCECGCGRALVLWGGEMDHWLSGWGRRRQKQAIANCWMLTLKCHAMRQAGSPSAVFWNEKFALHAAKYGYPAEPHIEHAALPAKAGGAP